MAYVLPITSYPDSTFNFSTLDGVLKIRTYWSGSIESRWMCDINDSNGLPVITGIALVTGCDNLLIGTGKDLLDSYRMVVYSPKGKENNTIDGFGTDCLLLWMDKTEAIPAIYG